MEEKRIRYAVIGADRRQFYLARHLADCNNQVFTYALGRQPPKSAYLVSVETVAEAIGSADIVIAPVLRNENVLSDADLQAVVENMTKEQYFFAGCIPTCVLRNLAQKSVRVYDWMKDAKMAYYNTIATAEGAVAEAISHSAVNLRRSRCAVLGYGKCGKAIADYLSRMLCVVDVFSEEEQETAQAQIVAEKAGDLELFAREAETYDFLFNTIPAMVIKKEILKKLKEQVTIIDIASAPGGVDYPEAEQMGRNARLCPGLPGTYAPQSSAEAIAETVQRIVALHYLK